MYCAMTDVEGIALSASHFDTFRLLLTSIGMREHSSGRPDAMKSVDPLRPFCFKLGHSSGTADVSYPSVPASHPFES